MKIRKLNESILREADEKATAVEVDPSASTSEIAKDISSTAAADGAPVSSEVANQKAQEIKSISDLISADDLAIIGTYASSKEDVGLSLNIKNKLTDILDRALRENSKFMDERISLMKNVYVCGLPGSSRTAVIKNWCNTNGINLVQLNAKDKEIDDIINGITVPLRDDNGGIRNVVKFRSKKLNALEKPNSVLFLDELNRQQSEALRGTLLDILKDKSIEITNEDGTHDKHTFNNLLFCIVTMNPSAENDLGATELNAAELCCGSYWVDFESTKESALEYFNKFLTPVLKRNGKFMLRLEPFKDINEHYAKYYKAARETFVESAYELRLATFILKSSIFRFSDRTDVERVANYEISKDNLGRNLKDIKGQPVSYTRRFAYVSQRGLSQLILGYTGDLDDFKDHIEMENFTPEDKEMFFKVLAGYVELPEDELVRQTIKRYKITAKDTPKQDTSTSTSGSAQDVDNKVFGNKGKSTVDVSARTAKIKAWLRSK